MSCDGVSDRFVCAGVECAPREDEDVRVRDEKGRVCGADVGPVEAAGAELGADGVGEDDGPGAADEAGVVAVAGVVDVAGGALGADERVDVCERAAHDGVARRGRQSELDDAVVVGVVARAGAAELHADEEAHGRARAEGPRGGRAHELDVEVRVDAAVVVQREQARDVAALGARAQPRVLRQQRGRGRAHELRARRVVPEQRAARRRQPPRPRVRERRALRRVQPRQRVRALRRPVHQARRGQHR